MRHKPRASQNRTGFTIVEAMIATAIVGIFFVGLYTGIGQCFGILANAREDLRANQILLDKMEEMRLYSWDQVNSYGTSTSFIPTNFVERFFPDGTNTARSTFTVGTQHTGAKSMVYYGTISITNVSFTNAYSANVKEVNVSLVWTNGAQVRQHSMSTLVSEYGMQKYIY